MHQSLYISVPISPDGIGIVYFMLPENRKPSLREVQLLLRQLELVVENYKTESVGPEE